MYSLHLFVFFLLLGRPYVVRGGLIKCSWCFFPSPGSLRRPSTDRRETLPHDRKVVRLDKFSPKIRGGGTPPPKKMGGQNMQNFGRFCTTSDFDREYFRNGTRYRKSERHVISSDSFRVQPKRSGELCSRSTTYREFHVSLNPLKCTFWQTIFQPVGGAAPWNFYTRYRLTQATSRTP